MMYTVEYEERHAGQTGAGTGQFWFQRVELFSDSMFDDPFERATQRVKLLWRSPNRFRCVLIICWNKTILTKLQHESHCRTVDEK